MKSIKKFSESNIMRKMRKHGVLRFLLILAIIIGGMYSYLSIKYGGFYSKDLELRKEKQDMYDDVYSKNANRYIWESLQSIDPFHKIKNYTIIKDSIHTHAAGIGYNMVIYVNNNKKLSSFLILSQDDDYKKVWDSDPEPSKNLQKFINNK